MSDFLVKCHSLNIPNLVHEHPPLYPPPRMVVHVSRSDFKTCEVKNIIQDTACDVLWNLENRLPYSLLAHKPYSGRNYEPYNVGGLGLWAHTSLDHELCCHAAFRTNHACILGREMARWPSQELLIKHWTKHDNQLHMSYDRALARKHPHACISTTKSREQGSYSQRRSI
jgi:hypothetical protein